jgi:hypothetical protein
LPDAGDESEAILLLDMGSVVQAALDKFGGKK